MVQITFHSEELKAWKCFYDSEISLKIMLLPEIGAGKVLRGYLFQFLQLRKHETLDREKKESVQPQK